MANTAVESMQTVVGVDNSAAAAPGKKNKKKAKHSSEQANTPRVCILCDLDPLQRGSFQQDCAFRGLRQLNCDQGRLEIRSRHRMALARAGCHAKLTPVQHWFPGTNLEDKLALALAARGAISLKEYAESVEFFTRVRKQTRAPCVADLCCGHGLTGLLFAVFERTVDRVVLVDSRKPDAYADIYAAVVEVAPWVADKVSVTDHHHHYHHHHQPHAKPGTVARRATPHSWC